VVIIFRLSKFDAFLAFFTHQAPQQEQGHADDEGLTMKFQCIHSQRLEFAAFD
jgi:hypothetical protein